MESKIKITGSTPATSNIKNVKTAVSLKYLSNFLRTLEIPSIIWWINLILTWSVDFFISSATDATKCSMANTKCYDLVVTLST